MYRHGGRAEHERPPKEWWTDAAERQLRPGRKRPVKCHRNSRGFGGRWLLARPGLDEGQGSGIEGAVPDRRAESVDGIGNR